MPLLGKEQRRRKLVLPEFSQIDRISQQYAQPAKIVANGRTIPTACIKCINTPCMYYCDHEISGTQFPDFSYERNNTVCPAGAISINPVSEMPTIDNVKCINCGLCALRCPMGAIYCGSTGMAIQNHGTMYKEVAITPDSLNRHKQFIAQAVSSKLQHRYVTESHYTISKVYRFLSACDGRSMIPNIFARNLLIALGNDCAISRAGDNYTRMDGVYSNTKAKGVIEVEFGRDTLEASRGILDDIAVMHARNNFDKNTNNAIVVCLSFPNKRQGYFQVIKDINRVIGLKIQTITIGALLVLAWNGITVDFSDKQFYVDFDSMSIRSAIRQLIGRRIDIPEGSYGMLEPEK